MLEKGEQAAVNGQNPIDDEFEAAIAEIESEIAGQVPGGGGVQGPDNTAAASAAGNGQADQAGDNQEPGDGDDQDNNDLPPEAQGILNDKRKYAKRAQTAEQQNQFLAGQVNTLVQQVKTLTDAMQRNNQPTISNPLDGLEDNTPMTLRDFNQMLDYREQMAEQKRLETEAARKAESQEIWQQAGEIGNTMIDDFDDVVTAGGSMLTDMEYAQLENMSNPVQRARASYNLCKSKLSAARANPAAGMASMVKNPAAPANVAAGFGAAQAGYYPVNNAGVRRPNQAVGYGNNNLTPDQIERLLELDDPEKVTMAYDRVVNSRNMRASSAAGNGFDPSGGRQFF